MRSKGLDIVVHITFAFLIIAVVFPLLSVVFISVSNAEDIQMYGYQFFPQRFSMEAYKVLFQNVWPLVRSILLTIGTSALELAISLVICAMIGYVLSCPEFAYRKTLTTYVMIPMFLSAGFIPTYILNTQYLHLNDTILIYLVPAVNTWTIILFRTFFLGVPNELKEAGRIDGASEMRLLWNVVAPLTKPIFAMQFVSGFLQRWNNFEKSLYYINKPELYQVQYFLQKILNEAQFLNSIYKENLQYADTIFPTETLPYAVTIISMVPVMIMFPFMQKYFAKGVTVGSVKG